ncbi:TBC1 domain family member 20-like [Protopterus annectens]|uniref:TBC1 domain family member 20-like n=1 Tax=Protopterus annectens TaxID=7888 RepID=UPI001CF96A98|nr:TBC1 domain family member 20-like [Protopterus annectens]
MSGKKKGRSPGCNNSKKGRYPGGATSPTTIQGTPGATGADYGSWKKQKLTEIHQALFSDPVDIAALRRAAVSKGGLLTDEIRRKVWPKLLNVNIYSLPLKPGSSIRENHKDFDQVLLDVRRSLRRFPKGMRAEQREVLQEQLIDIILYVLKRNHQLHYYQGYHDIVVTFLLVVGERMTVALVEKLSVHHLRDFMDPTMDSTKHILNYLMPILERVNPQLHDFMQRAEVGTIFALSWLITWYGHVLTDFRHVLRLYDFFLASHPLMAVYFAAQIVLYRGEEVLDCDCDMASVHYLLSNIPQNLPYEDLISDAEHLFSCYPPSELAKQAALQHHKSIAISSFQDFQLATSHQRPDTVLLKQRLEEANSKHGEMDFAQASGTSQLVKVAVWGISASLGAAALAVAQTALEWAPDFLLQLF